MRLIRDIEGRCIYTQKCVLYKIDSSLSSILSLFCLLSFRKFLILSRQMRIVWHPFYDDKLRSVLTILIVVKFRVAALLHNNRRAEFWAKLKLDSYQMFHYWTCSSYLRSFCVGNALQVCILFILSPLYLFLPMLKMSRFRHLKGQCVFFRL